MKKFLFLCLTLLLATTSAYANNCIAGYDERGRALYYEDCADLIPAQPSGPDMSVMAYATEGEGLIISGGEDTNTCSGVSCPSDMALNKDCCCVLK